MRFVFGIFVKNGGVKEFPNLSEKLFVSDLVSVKFIRNIKNNIADDAKVKKSAGIGGKKALIDLRDQL